MSQMYKVFTNNRTIFLISDQNNYFDYTGDLLYQYTNDDELREIIGAFVRFERMPDLYVFYEDSTQLLQNLRSLFPVVSAGGGIVENADNKILIIKRRGKWDLPKGKTEQGEDIKNTAEREVQEECGITDISVGKLFDITYHMYILNDEPVIKETYWYLMHYNGKEMLIPRAEEDITEAHWFSKNKLKPVHENTFPLISDLLQGVV
jgi:8-oxo-dGTP pyrophosphatase MutT (NUDIX family)